MDGELLGQIYHRLFADPNLRHSRDCKFPDACILLIWFFAVLSGISPRQARQKNRWPICYRRLDFPSYSQLMRRLGTSRIERHLHTLGVEFGEHLPRTPDKIADGKPLIIGGFSKDPDADRGHVPDGWARGYKLHVLADSSGVIERFAVTALSAGEATVLRTILHDIDLTHATVRADANYDSNPTYAAVARQGGVFVAPRRKPQTGLGHHRQHPHRLRAIEQLEHDPDAARSHKRARNRIEQIFGHLTGLPFGLAHLPNFVRRLPRVRRWVATKIALYHLYLAKSQTQRQAA